MKDRPQKCGHIHAIERNGIRYGGQRLAQILKHEQLKRFARRMGSVNISHLFIAVGIVILSTQAFT